MKKTEKTAKYLVALTLVLCTLAGVGAFAADLAATEQKNYLKNGPSPMDKEPETVTVGEIREDFTDRNVSVSLDGVWKLTDSGTVSDLAAGKGWSKAVDAPVPGSIYTALMNAGKIPDPYLGRNMIEANAYSSKNWYYMTEFTYSGTGKKVSLDFKGLCNVADIYLNGAKIGSHEGMFGGPFLDVTGKVKQGKNILLVHLKPAKDYSQTVVFNCSYGWHYAKLYPLGIWQSVTVRDVPETELDAPFAATVDSSAGVLDFSFDLTKASTGTLTFALEPLNFTGKTYGAAVEVKNTDNLRLRTTLPEFRLWYPNGCGEQNLYRLWVKFTGSDGGVSVRCSEFGIRRLEYQPFSGKGSSSMYNRVITVNGRKTYMKGANWCTIDAMMRFTEEDYDRILSRAHDAGINFFRAWGGGLTETDEFYRLCDRYGICVYQEWPCCWDSQRTQPAKVLYETVTLNVKRLRNYPSLVVYGGGNEGEAPFSDSVMNQIGRLTYELDGTRDFWRQDGGAAAAGISHDHIHWSGDTPEHYLSAYAKVTELNSHEYGLDSMMNLDSMRRFASEEELALWPIDPNGTVAYHTATFNGYYGWTPTPYGYDVDTFIHYAGLFTQAQSLEELIIGSQLAQAQADWIPAVNARLKFPRNSANVVYKMNDVYPGASWSIVDWYGAPKIAYYMMQDAYRTLMAGAQMTRYNTFDDEGKPEALTLPIYILDDNNVLAKSSWNVKVTAFDKDLKTVKTEDFGGSGEATVKKLGNFTLTAEQTDSTPLIVCLDLSVEGKFVNRTYYYFNYEQKPGCLFYLPRTTLSWKISGSTLTVKNTGNLPAISVYAETDNSAELVISDNYFTLLPGETAELTVNDPSLVKNVTCFNPGAVGDTKAPAAPEPTVQEVNWNSAKIAWNPAADESGIYRYQLYVNGELKEELQGDLRSFVLEELEEDTEYRVALAAVDNGGNESARSAEVVLRTETDKTLPQILTAALSGETLTVTFSAPMDRSSAENPMYYALNYGLTPEDLTLSSDGKTLTAKVRGAEAGKSYTLTAVGVRDNKKNGNRLPYTRVVMDGGLYLSLDLTELENGDTRTKGALVKTAKASGRGALINGVGFTPKEGTSIRTVFRGGGGSGFEVLVAKGEKTDGHFEFYFRDGALWFYAPEIGDIDLHYKLQDKTSWHTLGAVWTEEGIRVTVDGTQIALFGKKKTVSQTTGTLSVGMLRDGTLPFTGTVYEVSLYSRMLGDEELQAIRPPVEEAQVKGENVNGESYESDFTFPSGSAVGLWFKPDGFSGYNILLASSPKNDTNHFEIYTNDGNLEFYAVSGLVSRFGLDLNGCVDTWHHLLLVHQGGELIVYLDGEEAVRQTNPFSVKAGTYDVQIGRLVEGGLDFRGEIVSVTTYAAAPDGEEIRKIYQDQVVAAEERTYRIGLRDNAVILLKDTDYPVKLRGELLDQNPGSELPELRWTVSGDAARFDEASMTVRTLKEGDAVLKMTYGDGSEVSLLLLDVRTELPPETEDPTQPKATEEPENKKKGCGSAVTLGIPVLSLLAIGGSLTAFPGKVFRKKEEDKS